MIKWLVRIGLILVALVLVISVVAYFSLKSTQPPDNKDAPYILQDYYEEEGLNMPTRYYYTESIEIIDGNAVLHKYWRYDGAKYHKVNEEKKVEPPYKIIIRKGD